MISHMFESKCFQKIVCFDSTHKVEIPQGFPVHKGGKQKSANIVGLVVLFWCIDFSEILHCERVTLG